ncbi:hypothetical protein HDV01_001792 [Terramyces sp. JEL0728]|nr:hypothetical protein HDV01_001792 [Terramyces sp. JEL0728]
MVFPLNIREKSGPDSDELLELIKIIGTDKEDHVKNNFKSVHNALNYIYKDRNEGEKINSSILFENTEIELCYTKGR